jgi:hypothetical protein
MRIEPEVSGASIVIIGNFNAQIFQPFWLAEHEIITEAEAEAAIVAVIHPDFTRFSVDGEFSLQVERERFGIDRQVAPLIRIADITCRIFGDLLPHTPLKQLGINRQVHFDVGTEANRDQIGRTLAPPQPWGEWGAALSTELGGGRHGGLQSLTMRQYIANRSGWLQAKIEPSLMIGGGRSGIYAEINDHYDVGQSFDADAVVEIVRSHFDTSLNQSDAIIDHIMSLKP